MKTVLVLALVLAGCRDRIPKLKDGCGAQADCAITTLGADCCAGCESTAGNLQSLEERAAWCGKIYGRDKPGRCPIAKCANPVGTAYCLEDHCVVR